MIRPLPSFLRRGLLLAALALAPVTGLAGCSKADPQPAPAPVVDLSPVPAPAGLVAELFLPTPDATWAKARIAVGGPALFLPVNAGTLVANLLGLPVTAGQEIDGNAPVLGAVVDLGEGAAPAPGAAPDSTGAARQRARGAVGIRVKSGSALVAQLTRVEGARFQARVDAATSITLIEPQGAAPSGSAAGSAAAQAAPVPRGRAAMGVLGDYLLLGSTVEDLTLVGPYVARTLPKSPVPKEDLAIEIPRAAIDGPILTTVRGFWEKARGPLTSAAGGAGAADELALAPTIESWLAILGDLERARITVVLDEAAHLRVSGTPRAGGGAASRAAAEAAVGDVQPLLDLPGDALAGVLVREQAGARGEGVGRQAQALVRLLGGEVPEKDREAIAAALRAVAEARGDWFSAGLRWAGVGPTAYVRAAVSDEEKIGEAIEDLVELSKLPSVKAFLKEEKLRVSSAKHVVERLPGDARRIRFERVEEKGKKESKGAAPEAGADPAATLPRSVDLVYLLKDKNLLASAGYEPDEAMRRLVGAPEGERLGAVPAFQGAVKALGGSTSFALVLDPLRIVATRAGKPPQGDPTPVVLAAGAGGGDALWLRVDVPTAVIREVVRYRGAL